MDAESTQPELCSEDAAASQQYCAISELDAKRLLRARTFRIKFAYRAVSVSLRTSPPFARLAGIWLAPSCSRIWPRTGWSVALRRPCLDLRPSPSRRLVIAPPQPAARTQAPPAIQAFASRDRLRRN
jgi:hypothetical protein